MREEQLTLLKEAIKLWLSKAIGGLGIISRIMKEEYARSNEVAQPATYCACGQSFSLDHALSCNRGGFTILRHNELQDLTGELLSQVCHNVSTEPHLQPLNGEELRHNTAITEKNARLDLKANGV